MPSILTTSYCFALPLRGEERADQANSGEHQCVRPRLWHRSGDAVQRQTAEAVRNHEFVATAQGGQVLPVEPTDRAPPRSGPCTLRERVRHSRAPMEDLARATAAVIRALRERDENTSAHSGRTSCLALETGQAFGLSSDDLATLRLAAELHDVGKIGIPDRVLLKPGRLDDEEMRVMRTHPRRGHDILASIGGEESRRSPRSFCITTKPSMDRDTRMA